MDLRPEQFPSIDTHPIRLRQAVYDWLFRHSGAFSRSQRFLYYADRGLLPRKKFMERSLGGVCRVSCLQEMMLC